MNEDNEESRPYVMVIDAATPDQCWDIGKFCGSIGVTGVFKQGTLDEVHAREHGDRRSNGF